MEKSVLIHTYPDLVSFMFFWFLALGFFGFWHQVILAMRNQHSYIARNIVHDNGDFRGGSSFQKGLKVTETRKTFKTAAHHDSWGRSLVILVVLFKSFLGRFLVWT